MAITTPVSYWKLDGNSNDSIGGNNGTDTAITYSSGNGKIIQGAGYNGTTSSINVGSSANLSFTSSFTYSAWVKITNGVTSTNRIIERTNGSNYQIVFAIGAAGSGFLQMDCYMNGVDYYSRSTSQYNDGNWHFIVAVVNPSTGIKLFADGVEVAYSVSQGAFTLSGITGTQNIGSSTAGQLVDGAIDEVGIWNVALSNDEISKIYNAGRGNQYPFTENLLTSTLAYYKFDSNNSNDSVASYNGTDTSVTYGTGKIGNGAIFDATSDKIVFSTLTTFPTTNNFSINFWVNPSSMLVNYDSVGGLNDASNSWHVNMNTSNTMWFNHFDGSVDKNVTFSGTFSTSTWYMLSIVRNGDTVTTYVNGANPNANTGWSTKNFGTANGGFKLGQARTGTALPATYDEVGLWSRVLTSTEITQLYNSGSGTQYPFGTAYALVLAVGSYTYTGIASLFRVSLSMIMTVGSYTYTGISAIFAKGFGMAMDVGSYILTGINALFRTTGIWRNNDSKSVSTYTNPDNKSSSTWTNTNKNS